MQIWLAVVVYEPDEDEENIKMFRFPGDFQVVHHLTVVAGVVWCLF